MAEFVRIELMFHSKALEMYTQCYHSLYTQSFDDDLKVCTHAQCTPMCNVYACHGP